MEEIEEFLKPTQNFETAFWFREQRLIKALRAAIQQRDKQFDWFDEPEAKKKKTLANREICLFLKGVIQ